MLIKQEEMYEAARSIARGVPVVSLIDKHEELVKNSADIDVSGMSRQELRATLSDELNRANPNSPRWAPSKYEPIRQLELELLRAEFKEGFAQRRNTFMEELDADIDMLGKFKKQCIEAAMGEFGTIEPASTPDEQLKLLQAVIKLQDQEIKLKGLDLKLKQAFGHNPQAAITETLR